VLKGELLDSLSDFTGLSAFRDEDQPPVPGEIFAQTQDGGFDNIPITTSVWPIRSRSDRVS
jgi:hypothetical protein